jgi:hypothetical protein
MKTNEIVALALLAALLILIVYFVTAKGEKKRMTLINQEGKKIELSVEVANSTATRAKGLMGRSSLGEKEGMLFIFDRPGIYGFWMLNTTIPLDAFFFDENGTVVDIIEMEPCGLNVVNCPLHKPAEPSKYVLEVNQGFSKQNRISVGNSSLNISSLKTQN